MNETSTFLDLAGKKSRRETGLFGSTVYSLRAPTVRSFSNTSSRLRIVCISDTHGSHQNLVGKIPDGDILIHAGDFTNKLRKSDMEKSLRSFDEFLGNLPHKHKIVIAGNHEIAFNDFTKSEIQSYLRNCTYLQDSGITVDGLKIYGSPWTNSVGMGFSCRGKHLYKHWARIPEDVDILVTHIPPEGVLDLAFDFEADRRGPCPDCRRCHRKYAHWGSESLAKRVRAVRPRVHVFGHVHDSHGYLKRNGTLYVNAAQDNTEQPIFFDWEIEPFRFSELARASTTRPFSCREQADVLEHSHQDRTVPLKRSSPFSSRKAEYISSSYFEHSYHFDNVPTPLFPEHSHSPLNGQEEDTEKSWCQHDVAHVTQSVKPNLPGGVRNHWTNAKRRRYADGRSFHPHDTTTLVTGVHCLTMKRQRLSVANI
mmetsp:Transcript_20530/g.27059  ORF Transcript_20530/g.27059 Transcript_20530/m.27059 type:complete len:424 (-) Transcript_20530:80-1351(-)